MWNISELYIPLLPQNNLYLTETCHYPGDTDNHLIGDLISRGYSFDHFPLNWIGGCALLQTLSTYVFLFSATAKLSNKSPNYQLHKLLTNSDTYESVYGNTVRLKSYKKRGIQPYFTSV